MNTEMIKLLMWVVPLSLFLLFFVFGLLFGIWRGFRKSLILGIQALVAFAAVVITYVIFVNNPNTDSLLVSIPNGVMGPNYLQAQMGVSPDNTTLSQCLIELLSKNNNDYGSAISSIAAENAEYIATMANLIVRFVLAIVVVIIYLLLVFILYLIYLIFYPERRHKRKVERQIEEAKRTKPYKKHRLLGMLLGIVRGTVSGVVILSFFGSLLFMIAGTGEKQYQSIDFGDPQMNSYYDMYSQIAQYGNTGIFKVLNSLKNKDGLPYYLYATELVFSGTTKDKDGNTVKFRTTEEFAAYTGFANDTVALMAKYGETELKEIYALVKNGAMDNQEGQNQVFAKMTAIFTKPGFQDEYNALIDNFDAKVFFANFAISLIDSVAAHIDEFNLDGDTGEILKILFKKGYLSPKIAEEKALIDAGTTTGDKAYFTPSVIITKNDAKMLMKAVIGVLALDVMQGDTVQRILNISDGIIPYIKQLSILSQERKTEANPVLSRLYKYLDENMVSKAMAESTGSNAEIKTQLVYDAIIENADQIDWISEIQTLLDTGANVCKLGKNVYDPTKEYKDMEYLNLVFSVFEGEKKTENIGYYNSIQNSLSNSLLLGAVLQSTAIHDKLVGALKNVAPEVYISKNISYANSGEAKGEIYNLLDTLKSICEKDSSRNSLKTFINKINDKMTDTERLELISSFLKTLDDGEVGKRPLDYIMKSQLFKSVLSGVIISKKDLGNGIELYIPDSSLLLEDGVRVNVITDDELGKALNSLTNVIDVIVPFITEGNVHYNDIDYIIQNIDADELLQSKIIEGSIASILKNKLATMGGEMIVIPTSLNADIEAWLSTPEKDGEIKVILTGLKQSGLHISVFTNEYETDDDRLKAIIDELNNVTEESLNTLLNSKLLSYSISKTISTVDMGGLSIIVPNEVRELTGDEVLPYTISNAEVLKLISSVKLLIADGFSDLNKVVKNVINNRDTVLDSVVIGATVSSFVANDEKMNFLSIPNDLKLEASADNILNYTDGCQWDFELGFLFDALVEILDVDNLNFDDTSAIQDQIMDMVADLNEASTTNPNLTKLEVCYISTVLWSTLSNKIDELITTDILANQVVKNLAKSQYMGEAGNDYFLFSSTEISALIDTITVFDLDLNNLNMDTITGEVKKLNEIPEGREESKLHTAYKSVLIKYILSEKLDEILTADLIERDVRDYSEIKTYMSYENSKYYHYEENEVAAMIDSINVLGIDFNNFNMDDIAATVMSLNDNYDSLDPSKGTKLHKIYESIAIRYIIAKQLDSVLTSEVIIAEARDSGNVKNFTTYNDNNYNYYKEDELSAMLYSLAELGITDINNFNMDVVADNALNLNEAKVSNAEGTSKLDVIYNSKVVSYILSDKITSNIMTMVNPLVIYADEINENVISTNIQTIKKTEVSAMLYSLKEIGITDLDSFNMSDISAVVMSLNDLKASQGEGTTKLDVLYSSMIVKYILADKLDEVLDPLVDVASLEGAIKTTTGGVEDIKYYEKQEVVNMLYSLDELGVSDFESFDMSIIASSVLNLNANKSSDATGPTKLDVLYSSVIVRFILSDKLDMVLTDTTLNVNDKVIEASKKADEDLSTLKIYAKDSVKKLIISLTYMGVTDFENIDASTLSTKILGKDSSNNKFDISKLHDSLITWDLLTTNVSSALDSNTVIINHPKAKSEEDVAGVSLYKLSELQSIQDMMIECNVANFSSFEASNIKLNDATITSITNSYILMGTVSKNVKDNNNIILPESSYDDTDDLIVKADLTDLLNAIATFGEYSLSSFNANSITPNAITNIDTVAKSKIMRANITRNIKNADNPIFVSNDPEFAVRDTDLLENDITVLTEKEIKNLVSAFSILTGGTSFEAEIDFARLVALTSNEQRTILESNVVLHIVSEIFTNNITYGMVSFKYENLRVKAQTETVYFSPEGEKPTELEYTLEPNEDIVAVYPDIKYMFGPFVNQNNAIKLDGGVDNTKVLTKEDIMAFVSFMKKISTLTPGTDYVVKP